MNYLNKFYVIILIIIVISSVLIGYFNLQKTIATQDCIGLDGGPCDYSGRLPGFIWPILIVLLFIFHVIYVIFYFLHRNTGSSNR